MPSDHTTITARHRARTVSRAKSLRKHQRWLDQQSLLDISESGRRYQSQPNLVLEHFPEFREKKWYDSHWQHAEQTFGMLRRTMSMNMKRRTTTDLLSKLDRPKSELVSSSEGIPFPQMPKSKTSASTKKHSRASYNKFQTDLGIPWREVKWNPSKRKLGVRTASGKRLGLILTPYPATTTKSLSRVNVPVRPIQASVRKVLAESNVLKMLKTVQVRDKQVRAGTVKARVEAIEQADAASTPKQAPQNKGKLTTAADMPFPCRTNSKGSHESNITGSSSSSDFPTFAQLAARPLPPISQRFDSPPRAHTFAYLPRNHASPVEPSKPTQTLKKSK
jgi:hypothetical protein